VSSEGFLVRFLLGLAGSLAAAALAVGCATSKPHAAVLGAGQERGSWATPAELSWLKQLGSWNTRLVRGLQGSATTQSSAPTSLSWCEADLVNKVGAPPTARLQRPFEMFRRACRHVRRADAVGSQLLLQADQMLPPGEVRDLSVISGDTEQSRIEPRFGRIASTFAGKAVEARCWSASDWQRLMREERIYTGGHLGSDTLGFAGINGDRVNLSPDVCSALVDLAYNGGRPVDEAGVLLLAAAVVTLSHEPQHSKGIAREAVAECNAIQTAQRTAVKLGASRAYSESLVRMYWRHYGEELEAYRSPDCRRGGALDLGYADSIWP
jgi:hypothetical protein